jgi:hypothetical protein
MQFIALKYFGAVAENGNLFAAAVTALVDFYFDQKRLRRGTILGLTIFERSRREL